MNNRRLFSLFLSALTFSISTGALAAANFDQHVLSKLHAGDQNEIKLGELALKNSQTPDVRAFAQRLIDDHTKNDTLVEQAAYQEHLILSTPSQADIQDDQNLYEQLSRLKGREFDKVFRQAMIEDHKKDATELTDALPKLKDRETKQVVSQTIPMVRDHEQMAIALT